MENLDEKGLSTLFVIFGMATWPATDGGRPAEAPVLLLPVALSKREGSNSCHLARSTEGPSRNCCFLQEGSSANSSNPPVNQN